MNPDFGKYRLSRLLGEGGMAQVWEATRQTPGHSLRCAVKIIKPAYADLSDHREMFMREGQLSLVLSGHDNVVSVFDVGQHQGRPYLAMELVDGMTLAQLSRNLGGPWPVAQAVGVVAGILRALCHIHDLGQEQGIVHRDVTPHNVMVSRHGEVKLMDFGIAQRLGAEPSLDGALGKLSYVPREQVEGDPDARADLYATGAVLFELLDGRRFRWHCADEDALFQEIYRDRVPTLRRKDIPAPVLSVLRGLLQPRREQRIASAAEALRRLEAWEGFSAEAQGVQQLYAYSVEARPRVPSRPVPSVVPSVPSGDVPRVQPWDERSPTAEHPRSHPWLMAEDIGRGRRVPTQSHPCEAVGVAHTDEIVIADVPTTERPSERSSGVVSGRRRKAHSRPAWAAEPRRPMGSADPSLDTRVVPAAEQDIRLGTDPMERQATRRHPAALRERDIPVARNAAEIAVTQPQPSRRAPWAEGTEPIEGRTVQAEPGAPVLRRRRRSSDAFDAHDRTGSVSPRRRESAAMHEVAGDVVTGEICIEERPAEVVLSNRWHVGLV